jgi:hypothetical protein
MRPVNLPSLRSSAMDGTAGGAEALGEAEKSPDAAVKF